jgi:hypothetical protein
MNVTDRTPSLDENEPEAGRDEPDTDQLADDIAADIAAICATRADLAAAVIAVVRADYL